MSLPYADRRAVLDALDLDGPAWRTPEAFDDGEALLEAAGVHGLKASSPSAGVILTGQASAAG